MPGMDGWSVLRALKADPQLADIPVVMVTFINDNGLATRARRGRPRHQAGEVGALPRVMDRFRDTDGDVLVVDDNADTRRHLRAALERDSWSVTEAANGREALERVARHVRAWCCSTSRCRSWMGSRSCTHSATCQAVATSQSWLLPRVT